ncbi:uncharacterized protein N7477_003129 [Penicillium maclennaniae]|uniref:uncharacterized protein n=1 Tax=Penicillium maclennaniae TaxID=1343394 RepID=UPI002540A054|nr:uncharacterized protein N7477_003129 [Penicillium maclennaniae]KAJ5677496.1 hypothetical protein N7477_003129 [Penicillium maclennaniae]
MAPLDDVQVGDLVNVPGGMYGTVKFLGSVAGKPGRFAGIELSSEHAARGKNNGDVDGRKYFTTSIPGSGIFVPMNNSKYVTRRSTSLSASSYGGPPTTPSRGPANFSKSVGPALTTPRPRMRRPSLPRPESPRIAPPKLSLGGLRTPSAASKSSMSNGYPRSPVKAPSRLSDRPSSRISMDDDASSYGRPSDSHRASSSEIQDLKDQIKSLERQLLDRDKQLNEQSNMLGEVQKTLEEMEGIDALSVRTQLHFRSTLDTLEIAASETERVYEQRLDELMQQNKELQDRGEDVEIVAQQLKQLEELVSELEEGLEDARRGEAEARAEVEFLRGEVERTKIELKRERDNVAAALKDAHSSSDGYSNSQQLEQKDDEIRGLKAIIHSLSHGNPNAINANEINLDHQSEHHEQVARLEQRLQEAEGSAEHKNSRIEELERQLEELRLSTSNVSRNRSSTVTPSPPPQQRPSNSGSITANDTNHAHRLSDRTVVPNDWHDAHQSLRRLESMPESERSSDDDALWCEICETGGHDILNCTSMFGSGVGKKVAQNGKAPEPPAEQPVEAPEAGHEIPQENDNHEDDEDDVPAQKTGRDVVLEGLRGISGLGASMSPIAGKSSGVIDESKWCALCERDGHESIDCPFDE